MQPHSWQSLSVAAARVDRCHGHLRRLCELGRVPASMRRRGRLANGQTGWLIRSDFTLPNGHRRPATIAQPPRIIITIPTPGHVRIDVFGSASIGR